MEEVKDQVVENKKVSLEQLSRARVVEKDVKNAG